jgi:8-oxo-dGTP pyrophosphatase MutT (NUDIX family)
MPPSPLTPAALAAAVAARVPVDERERRSIERFATELARLDRPYDEHADPVHVTGSAIITGPRGVVLHLHKRMNLWLQPGGHVDDGEDPADAALREAREETGLDLVHAEEGRPTIAHVDAHDGPKGHFHLDVRYLLTATTDADPTPPPEESQDCRWFAWDEAIDVADDGLAGALRALRPPH